MKKLYCYVDESGQDPKSEVFIVVAVVSAKEQNELRRQLEEIEHVAGTGRKKWHKLRRDNRIQYLTSVLKQKIASGDVYFAQYKKPILYFFPLIDVLERSLKKAAQNRYQARIYIDGIDKQKSKELTNALRASGISLRMVKGLRDESEPLIRLADMWAGCIRSAFLHHGDAQQLLRRAKREVYLHDLSPS